MEIMKELRNNKGHKASFYTRYVRLVLWFFNKSDTTYFVLMKRITTLIKTNGEEFTVNYLKEAVRLVNHYLAGRPTTCPQEGSGPRVASRRGLPLIIPGPLRLLIEGRDSDAIRIVLTILSVFRVIKYEGRLKLETITQPFTGLTTMLAPWEIGYVWSRFTSFLPSVKLSEFKVDRPLILKTAGPNYKTSILGAPIDAMAWKAVASEESRKAFKILSDNSGSKLWDFLEVEIQTVSGYLPLTHLTDADGNHTIGVKIFGKTRVLKLGKLSKKLEPAGKIRVFAIADVWTQSVLKPYHEYLFSILRAIPQDGTFDQAGPLNKLRERLNSRPNKWVASYDLSAATDRLPIDVQVQVMSQLFSREVAEAWKTLLVDRDWWLGDSSLRYSVGQPMGALSSWAMLALTHHVLVQTAAKRVGYPTWFEDYALLGDDIVIANEAVAMAYHHLMTEELGVEINLSKSILSDIGVVEFAKRIASPSEEYTPLGPKSISGILSNPAYLPQLFLDFIGKGGLVNWEGVFERLNNLLKQKDLIRVSKSGIEALTWTVLQPFGFVPYPGVASEEIATSLEDMEVDPFLLIEGMSLAAQYLRDKEQDQALVKTTETVNALRKVINRWEVAGYITPPSFQWVLFEAERYRSDILMEYIEPSQVYVDPTGLTPGEVLRKILETNSAPSPLDNLLNRPKVVKPRIKRVSLDFFKLVRRHIKFLMMM